VTEQRLVFGDVAEQYDDVRPGYPGGLFDAVMTFGALELGARALEIGAGTGKATVGFVARGLRVHALEPSAGMATVLRAKGIDAEETGFEEWQLERAAFDVVYAAQAWHWVKHETRCSKVAAALRPGGIVALFWNTAREWTDDLGRENDAMYDKYAPHMTSSVRRWSLDSTLDELRACDALTNIEKQVVTWSTRYTRNEYTQLLGTHSDHRMLADDVRSTLHAAIGEVIDRHGGQVEVVYDVNLYMARRRA
jgi:SAM-dependent methyltransferase